MVSLSPDPFPLTPLPGTLLSLLHGTLNRIAEAHGSTLPQATELFFDLLDGSEGVVISGLEKKRLEAETKLVEKELIDLNGELKRLNDVVTEHQVALDSLNRLKKSGVNEQDLTIWRGLLKRAGGSVETFSQAVERYAGFEGALSQIQAKLDAQGREKRRLAKQISGLGHDTKTAISELRELREQALVSSVDKGKLEKDVGHLSRVVGMAEAFLTTNAEAMMRVPAMTLMYFLGWRLLWQEQSRVDPKVRPPKNIQGYFGRSLYGASPLADRDVADHRD